MKGGSPYVSIAISGSTPVLDALDLKRLGNRRRMATEQGLTLWGTVTDQITGIMSAVAGHGELIVDR